MPRAAVVVACCCASTPRVRSRCHPHASGDRLPEEYREVITLARIVGLSRAEIGAQMDKSEGAVRMLLARALAELAEHLAPAP